MGFFLEEKTLTFCDLVGIGGSCGGFIGDIQIMERETQTSVSMSRALKMRKIFLWVKFIFCIPKIRE